MWNKKHSSVLPAVLALLMLFFMSACGMFKSTRKNFSDAPAPVSPLNSDTVVVDLVFGDEVIALQDIHDSFEISMRNPNGVVSSALAKQNLVLKPGLKLQTQALPKSSNAVFSMNLYKNSESMFTCLSNELDLTQADLKNLKINFKCSNSAGVIITFDVNSKIEIAPQPFENLTPNQAFDKLVNQSTIFSGTASYLNSKFSVELSFIKDESSTNTAKIKITDIANGNMLFQAIPVTDITTLSEVIKTTIGNFKLTGEGWNVQKTEKAVQDVWNTKSFLLTAATELKFVSSAAGKQLLLPLVFKVTESEISTTNPSSNSIEVSLISPLLTQEVPLTKVQIGTYNVENFWDDNFLNTPNSYNDFSEKYSNWYSDGMAAKKAKRIATAIALAGSPDVLVFEEIESANNKSRSLEILRPLIENQGYKYFALGLQSEENPTSVTTAVISKFPIVKNENLNFNYTPSANVPADLLNDYIFAARDPQVVTVKIGNIPVLIYVSHWKSQRSSGTKWEAEEGDAQRLAVARLIRSDMNARKLAQPNLDIIVMGDFNTDYSNASVVNGLETTSNETELMSANGSSKLYNLWNELAPNKRCSYSFNDLLGCIDNILVNDALYDNSGLQLINNSFVVHGHEGGLPKKHFINANGLPFRSQIIKQFTSDKDESGNDIQKTIHIDKGYSDHLPLVASYLVLPLQNAPTKINEAPSSLAAAPQDLINPMNFETCANSEVFTLNAIDSRLPQYQGLCFEFQSDEGVLLRKGTGRGYFKTGKNFIDVSFGLLYSKNKPKRNFFELNEGKILKKTIGRLGWEGNNPILYANSETDFDIQPEKPCSEAAHAVMQVKADTAYETLKAYWEQSDKSDKIMSTCVAFTDLVLKTSAVGPKKDATTAKPYTAGTIQLPEFVPTTPESTTLPTQKLLSLVAPNNDARFTPCTQIKISGLAKIDFRKKKDELELNLMQYSRTSGSILTAEPVGNIEGCITAP